MAGRSGGGGGGSKTKRTALLIPELQGVFFRFILSSLGANCEFSCIQSGLFSPPYSYRICLTKQRKNDKFGGLNLSILVNVFHTVRG